MLNQNLLIRLSLLAFVAGLFVFQSASEPAGTEAGDELFSIEIDGKFTKAYPTWTFVAGAHSKLGFTQRKEDAREKRELNEPPLNFNGTLTFRTPGKVQVIGVSASFSLDLNQAEEGDAPTTNSERLKRAIEKPTIVWYGQFRFEAGNKENILGIRAEVSIGQLTSTPEDKLPNPLVDDLTMGFQGTLTSIRKGDAEAVGFIFNLGLKDGTIRNRLKRDTDDSVTLKLDGKWTQQSKRPLGKVVVDAYAIKGEAIIDDYTEKQIPSPSEEFNKSGSRHTALVETDGNFKVKVNGEEVFALPFKEEWLGSVAAEELNGKRSVRDAKQNEMLEIEYKSNISIETGMSRKYNHPPITYGVTANLKFWEISNSE